MAGKDAKKRTPIKLRVRGVKGTKHLIVEVPKQALTKDEGNFTFGYCHSCDWRGPGRRARDKARADAKLHADQCPKKGKVTVAKGEVKN